MKNLFLALLVGLVTLGNTFAQNQTINLDELLTSSQNSNQDVVSWLYTNGLTRYSSATEFRPYDSITRGEAAKFMVEYAQLQNMVKVKSADECQFNDISNYDSTLRPYIIQACEYGIFKGSNGSYFPQNNITKGEAITVVMRTKYGILNEDINPRYLPYYNKANEIDLSLPNISLFNNSIERIELGLWIKESNDVSIEKVQSRDGDQQKYDVSTLEKVLNGNRDICATVDELHSYYCSSTNTDSIKSWLQVMKEGSSQEASYLMNQEYLIPPTISSFNRSAYFLPYKQGVIGFTVGGNAEPSYRLTYVTIKNGILYVNHSQSYFVVGNKAISRFNGFKYPQYTKGKTYIARFNEDSGYKDGYYIQLPNYCYDIDLTKDYAQYHQCIDNYLQGVMLNNIDDPDTQSRIDAMKKKIDQWYQ